MLPEVDQQLRKVEAAQRRRLQAEKAAKKAEVRKLLLYYLKMFLLGCIKKFWFFLFLMILQAEAIRKILGQDSTRKKREEKLKRQQEELAQVVRLGKINWVIIVFPMFHINFILKQQYNSAGENCQSCCSWTKHRQMGEQSVWNCCNIFRRSWTPNDIQLPLQQVVAIHFTSLIS